MIKGQWRVSWLLSGCFVKLHKSLLINPVRQVWRWAGFRWFEGFAALWRMVQSRDHCTNTDLKPRQSQTLSSVWHAYRTQYGRTPSHTWSRTKVKAVKRRVDVQHHSGKRTHDSIRWLARWRRGWTWAARQVWRMKVWITARRVWTITSSVTDDMFVCQVCRDSTHTTTFIPKRS